jgi:hypothetical protein
MTIITVFYVANLIATALGATFWKDEVLANRSIKLFMVGMMAANAFLLAGHLMKQGVL